MRKSPEVSGMYLSVENLTVGYGARPILREFTAGVEHGDFLAVVGPNGCGKSTLVKAMTRGLRPAAGKVLLGGRDIWAMRSRDLARQVAVVAQETAVEFEFTVEEVVMMGRLPHLSRFHGESAADQRAVQAAMAETNTLHLPTGW
jgi:iron complex transport system ATP-binding protein